METASHYTNNIIMAKEVIFIADDLGMNAEVNDAIIHAHRSGELTGAALMMAQPATDAAVEMARANPSLQIGWHLHLNDSEPATVDAWPWGDSPLKAGLAIGLSSHARDFMRREVKRQWQLFQHTGLPCHFINSHHHLHTHPHVYQALLEAVGPAYPGWVRLGQLHPFDTHARLPIWSMLNRLYLNRRRRLSPWRTTDTLWGVDRTFKMNADEVRAAIAALPDGFHEFLFHPRSRSCPDTLCLLQLKSSPEHS
jgi:YdjC-like protein